MRRFEGLLGSLPSGFVFYGEIVCLDERGRPVFEGMIR
jgi:hypothetical protein